MTNSDDKKTLSTDSLKTAKQWHLYWVYNDPEFIIEVNKLKTPPDNLMDKIQSKWREPYIKLANIYKIDYLKVYLFKVHGINAMLVGASLLPKGSVRYDARDGFIELKIKREITQKEFYKLWEEIDRIKKQVLQIPASKRRAPDDPQLIYAIFKSRNANKTFREIFQQYQDGSLEYYNNKPMNHFSSEDSLQAYYYKYKPIT